MFPTATQPNQQIAMSCRPTERPAVCMFRGLELEPRRKRSWWRTDEADDRRGDGSSWVMTTATRKSHAVARASMTRQCPSYRHDIVLAFIDCTWHLRQRRKTCHCRRTPCAVALKRTSLYTMPIRSWNAVWPQDRNCATIQNFSMVLTTFMYCVTSIMLPLRQVRLRCEYFWRRIKQFCLFGLNAC